MIHIAPRYNIKFLKEYCKLATEYLLDTYLINKKVITTVFSELCSVNMKKILRYGQTRLLFVPVMANLSFE